MQSAAEEKLHNEGGPVQFASESENGESKLQDERAPGKVLNTVSTEHSVDSVLYSNQSVIFEADQSPSFGKMALVLVLVTRDISYRVEVSSKLSVEALNEVVQHELRIARQDYLLIHKGRELKAELENTTRLEPNSVVYVLPSRPTEGNDILTVNLQKGRTLLHAINFIACDRVAKITAAVTELFGIPPQHQTLMYCGAALPNKTLAQCRLINNCRVKLVISPQYKREMSKSCTFNDRKDKVELEKEPLPQIQELAKEVQSIEDIDDQIFQELVEPKIIEPSLEDSFDEHIDLSRHIRKKRSTYSSAGANRITMSQEKPTKSEIPKLQPVREHDCLRPGLLQVKEVSSIYNCDSEDFDESCSRSAGSHNKNRLKNSHGPIQFQGEQSVRITHFDEAPA